jgi:transmembrane sensor
MTTIERNDAQLDFQAAEWLIRLEDVERPATSRQQAEFFAWIRRSPRHLQAFMEAADLWRGLEGLDPGQQIDLEKLLAGRFASVSSLHHAPAARARRWRPSGGGDPSRTHQRRWLAAAAALLACLLPVLAWKWLHDAPTYVTDVSEQRTFRLDDGSLLQLNTRSEAKVLFDQRARRIELVDGEAMFSVERDPDRPFVVSTSSATVRAIGTRFNVRDRDGVTTVAVIDGKVQVSGRLADSHAPRSPTLLATGETASVSTDRVVRRDALNVADAVAWRERRLVFRDASLAEVAAEFNRYGELQFRFADEASAGRRLTGIFSADHPQSFILYLEREGSLEIRRRGAEIVIARKPGESSR